MCCPRCRIRSILGASAQCRSLSSSTTGNAAMRNVRPFCLRPGRIRLASERDKPVDKRGLVDKPRRSRATPGSASAFLMIHYQPIPFVLQANKFPNPRRGLDYARQIMLPEFGYYFFNAFLIWVPTARARRIGESMR